MGEPGWHTPNIVNGGKGWKVVQTHFDPGPIPPVDDSWRRNETSVVVLVAALREARLAATLESFFKNAAHPKRVYFAVVQQNLEEDEDVVVGFCKKMGTPAIKKGAEFVSADPSNPCLYLDNIRVIRMAASEARGPVFARARQAELVRPDDQFCMQIDAHTVVVKDWDLRMLAEWGATNNEYAVLTSYPTNFKDLDQNSNNHWEMPHMCGAEFEGFGKVRNAQASAAANLEVPILSPLWAAGLSFHRCHAERDVPNDINLKGVFSGEEFSRGARLWTHGYDFYSIRRPIVGTYYGGEKGGKGSWAASQQETTLANNRMATLLRWPKSDQSPEALAALKGHELGDRRTLEMYINFSGVDTIHQKTVRTCDHLVYVPWLDHGVTTEPQQPPQQQQQEQPQQQQQHINTSPTAAVVVVTRDIEVGTVGVEPASLRASFFVFAVLFFVFLRFRKWFRLKSTNSKAV